jgi:DNA-binding NtrC family response regulator
LGDLSMESQAKLLRFLEDGEFYRVGGTRKHNVRTRVVSATNKDLGVLIDKGLFREDLYYRLAVVKVTVPSLNERPDDIVPMALHFLLEFNQKFGKSFTGITPEAEGALKEYRWRGNVRELKNIMERAALIGNGSELSVRELGLEGPATGGRGKQGPEDPMFPAIPPEGLDLASIQEALERRYFEEALNRSGGNESRAAKLLNINHHTFRYRRRKLGL